MNVERLVKISRDDIPAGKRSPRFLKRRSGNFKQAESPITKKKKKNICFIPYHSEKCFNVMPGN